MLASRYADPEAVAAADHQRNKSVSSNTSKPAEDANPAGSWASDATSPSTHATSQSNVEETSPQKSDDARPKEATEKPWASRERSADDTTANSPYEAKPVPPLPHVAELEQYRNLPEPSIILASSPGVTTPEIGPSTPQPTTNSAYAPPQVAEPAATAPETVKTPLADLIPKSISPALPAALTKARRSKAGKPCMIRLPTDKTKTYSGYPVPLSLDEFKARIDKFEKSGYDTRGFGYWKDSESIEVDARPAQARAEFPDPAEQIIERQDRNFGVSVPDRKKWDSYVNELMEEKLRALGVTSGDDEPAPPTMSRQVSSSPFPSLPMSPPIPSSSAASQHMWQNTMPFSAPFSPAASTNNTSIGAVASPAPSLGQQMHPSHMSRQSTFGFPFQGAQAPFGMQQPWSPHQMPSIQGSSRGVSPAVSGGMPRTTSGFSHDSPDVFNDRQTTPRGQQSSAQPGSRADQASSWRSDIQPEQTLATKNASEDAAKDDDATLDAFADLASPKPQGHRHNISANLEREAENAQYYPGEYVNESREASPSRKTSAASTRDRAPGHQTKPSHASNMSISSRLNVGAKEFKYDPTSSQGSSFSFSKDAFLPNAPKAKAADATSSVQFATAHSHQGSVSLSHLNVAAPEFKPPAQKNFAFSSSWFNFSAKKPNEASKITDAPKSPSAEEKVPTIGSKIFGNIADIVKPAKKSKAVPIVDPNEADEPKDESGVEDEDGRVGPGDLRRKKGRFAQDDGDEVPRFAEPTPEPEVLASSTSQPDIDVDLRASPAAPSPGDGEEDVDMDTIRPRASKLALDDDLAMGGNLSDGSNVPWHGIESDDRPDEREGTPNIAESDLLTSPTGASGIEELSSSKRDSRGLSPETPDSRSGSHTSLNAHDKGSLLYPSYQELDAVMDYINKDNSDFGVEDEKPASQNDDLLLDSSVTQAPEGPVQMDEEQRDLPSPLPEHQFTRPQPRKDSFAVSSNGRDVQRERGAPKSVSPFRQAVSPVRKLNKMAEGPVSDWDDMLSSGEELQIPHQNHLNDAHVATLVEGLLRRHLAPFERQLKDLSASIKRPSFGELGRPRPFSAYEKSDSDADDEDDTDNGSRLRSRGGPRSERRIEQIRSVVMEAMAASQSDGIGQIEQEVKFRKAAENRADDIQRILTLSEREIALLKESVTSSDDKVQALEQEQTDLRRHHKGVEDELRTKTLDFTAEIAALENTLDEYRASSTKWREEIDSVKTARAELETTIHRLKKEATDSQREREELGGKLSKVEEELAASNTKLLTERSTWDRQDHKQASEVERLQGKLAEAIQGKDRLDQEVSRLNQLERDAIKTAVVLEETQNAKSKLEAMVNRLNDKTIEHQTIVARYEREASEAHENTSVQVDRTKALMQTDIDIANKRVENVRADLETRLQMIKSELDNVRKDNEAVRGRYERSLNEAIASRKEALQDSADSSKAQLVDERRRFEQSLNELSTQHDRAMRNAIEDKQRSETHLNSSLKLSEAKVTHLEDKLHQLEDRLSVAQSAAQAAAVAAQSAKSQQSASAATSTAKGAPTTTIATPSHLEKISPQALRESVVVLQEQLQEREARIETLESEIGTIGRDAPAKLQERETEIGWLRELLGVRIDDLSDLVNNLQMEKFDRGAARNAAIRIKANLQMEQQEKNRVLHGMKPTTSTSALPSLSDIQNFASPKAAQLTSAFNNWRKAGPPSLAGMREAANANTPSKPTVSASRPQMPSRGSASSVATGPQSRGTSPALKNPIAAAAAANAAKPSEADSFLSGLMTPPASNLRRTPSTGAASAKTARPHTPDHPGSPGSPGRSLDPTTPPLLRKGDYDLDAELGPDRVEFEGSGDEGDEAVEETAEQTELEPFGEVVASPAAAE